MFVKRERKMTHQIQTRSGETFEDHSQWRTLEAARFQAERLHATGRFNEVIVRNINSGKQAAYFWARG